MGSIVIQRGHVPRTSGATGAPGEQQFAIEAGDRAAYHVRAIGHNPILINADESNSRYRGDAFFAIHYDSSRDPGARGASVGYQSSEGAAVARIIKRHYENNGWPTGNWRPDNYTAALAGYYGVRRAVSEGNRHAIIFEAGFHSNAPDSDPELEDSQLLASPSGPDRVGISIAATVVDLFGVGGGAPCPPAEGIPAYPGAISMAMGSEGHAVKVWQTEFNNHYLGWNTPNTLVVDGICGPATNHVIFSFQWARGLVADGVAGPATWHELLFG